LPGRREDGKNFFPPSRLSGYYSSIIISLTIAGESILKCTDGGCPEKWKGSVK
jgi:hypothetical protein